MDISQNIAVADAGGGLVTRVCMDGAWIPIKRDVVVIGPRWSEWRERRTGCGRSTGGHWKPEILLAR
jgi:hypothetical protein